MQFNNSSNSFLIALENAAKVGLSWHAKPRRLKGCGNLTCVQLQLIFRAIELRLSSKQSGES